MKVAKFLAAFALVVSAVFIASCQAKNDDAKTAANDSVYFRNEAYNFSFSHTSGWRTIEEGLPDRWAMIDADRNTVIFIVSGAKSSNLLDLGRSQALADIYPNNTVDSIEPDKLVQVFSIVKLERFNNREWYTYGMEFADKGISSIISGTLCNDKEILMVLTSSKESFEKNRDIYLNTLGSFSC